MIILPKMTRFVTDVEGLLLYLKKCKAMDAECNFCGQKGHFKSYCKKAGNFPGDEKKENSTKKNNFYSLTTYADYYCDEDGEFQMVQN